jgi:tyrosyl-tRNA synthetase
VETLRSLIDVVVLKPVDRGFEIELVGDITKMIELPEGSSDLRSHASSVKVVAGARKQRESLILPVRS